MAVGLLLRIRKNGTSNRRMRVAGPKVPALGTITGHPEPWWCLETRAEWDAAPDYLALRISPNWAFKPGSPRRALRMVLRTYVGSNRPYDPSIEFAEF